MGQQALCCVKVSLKSVPDFCKNEEIRTTNAATSIASSQCGARAARPVPTHNTHARHALLLRGAPPPCAGGGALVPGRERQSRHPWQFFLYGLSRAALSRGAARAGDGKAKPSVGRAATERAHSTQGPLRPAWPGVAGCGHARAAHAARGASTVVSRRARATCRVSRLWSVARVSINS